MHLLSPTSETQTQVLEKQNWEENWIKTAEEIVQEEFKQNYEESPL